MEPAFLTETTALLARTPATLNALLRDLPSPWTIATEGLNGDGEPTWSPQDVIGHLLRGEQFDWMPRLQIILTHGPSRPFHAFDRQAHFDASQTTPLPDLLDQFAAARAASLAALGELNLQPHHLLLTGTHPDLGEVTLRQLLATWAAHDLAHILQISRTMAKRYKQEVGPWAAYLSVMQP
jgi:hypothetical protein